MKKRLRRPNPPASEQVETLPEEELERIEADPRFQAMMKESDRAEREGRSVPHEEVVKRFEEAHARRR